MCDRYCYYKPFSVIITVLVYRDRKRSFIYYQYTVCNTQYTTHNPTLHTHTAGALTVGPQGVAALHNAAPNLLLDVHVVSDCLLPLLQPLADAGATRITVQLEQQVLFCTRIYTFLDTITHCTRWSKISQRILFLI